MDADRFDTLIRSLSVAPSRRGLLNFTLGGALALLLGNSDAEGKKKNKKRRCSLKCLPPEVPIAKQCNCCLPNGETCTTSGDCCSGICTSGSPSRCTGLEAGAQCGFHIQCASGVCSGHRCT